MVPVLLSAEVKCNLYSSINFVRPGTLAVIQLIHPAKLSGQRALRPSGIPGPFLLTPIPRTQALGKILDSDGSLLIGFHLASS